MVSKHSTTVGTDSRNHAFLYKEKGGVLESSSLDIKVRQIRGTPLGAEGKFTVPVLLNADINDCKYFFSPNTLLVFVFPLNKLRCCGLGKFDSLSALDLSLVLWLLLVRTVSQLCSWATLIPM